MQLTANNSVGDNEKNKVVIPVLVRSGKISHVVDDRRKVCGAVESNWRKEGKEGRKDERSVCYSVLTYTHLYSFLCVRVCACVCVCVYGPHLSVGICSKPPVSPQHPDSKGCPGCR